MYFVGAYASHLFKSALFPYVQPGIAQPVRHQIQHSLLAHVFELRRRNRPVSYTHLTLPTICSV